MSKQSKQRARRRLRKWHEERARVYMGSLLEFMRALDFEPFPPRPLRSYQYQFRALAEPTPGYLMLDPGALS